MSIDLTLFGTRDAKLIRENPNATPYDLLQIGLSHKAYMRLTTEPAGKLAPPEPVTPAENTAPAVPGVETVQQPPVSNAPIQPHLVEEISKRPHAPRFGQRPATAASQPQRAFAGYAQVTIIGPTGIPQRMAAKQAQRMVARNPALYKIV